MSSRSNVMGAAVMAVGLAAVVAAQAQPAFTHLSDDAVATVSGIRAGCTGVGLAARQDPRWKAFPVRVEVSTASRDYLGEARLAVARASGEPVVAVSCNSPWVLLGLAPGDYKVTAWSGDKGPRSLRIHAPAQGQARFVVAFP